MPQLPKAFKHHTLLLVLCFFIVFLFFFVFFLVHHLAFCTYHIIVGTITSMFQGLQGIFWSLACCHCFHWTNAYSCLAHRTNYILKPLNCTVTIPGMRALFFQSKCPLVVVYLVDTSRTMYSSHSLHNFTLLVFFTSQMFVKLSFFKLCSVCLFCFCTAVNFGFAHNPTSQLFFIYEMPVLFFAFLWPTLCFQHC